MVLTLTLAAVLVLYLLAPNYFKIILCVLLAVAIVLWIAGINLI